MYKEIVPGLLGYVQSALPGGSGFVVRSFIIKGSTDQAVVDSLMRPRDIEAFSGASTLIYSHADWDHCWGSAALPKARVIGHAHARHRMHEPGLKARLDRFKQGHAEFFAGASIVPPGITFTESLELDLGGVALRLCHCPGHTADSLTVEIIDLEIMLVGDALEEPIPYINEPGYVTSWVRSMRKWSKSGVKAFYCSHGQRMLGIEDVIRTADYLEALSDDVHALMKIGAARAEIVERLPISKYLADAEAASDAHVSNIEKIATAVS